MVKWRGKEKVVANNLVFILEELRKRLEVERDRLAQDVFNRLLDDDEMRFMVVLHDLGMNRTPKEIEVNKTVPRDTRLDGNQFVMNLYDAVASDTLDNLDHKVASFLDEQS